MSANCNNGITIPTLITDSCNGEVKLSDCVIYQDAITYLGLPANSNITTIIEALVLSLKDARDRILVLETP